MDARSQSTAPGGGKNPTRVPFHLGITNCVLGVISIVLSSIAMTLPSNIFHVDWHYNILGTGEGVWCGAFAIAAGILGMLTDTRPSVSMYTASGVLGILSAMISLVGFGLPVNGALACMTLYRGVPLLSLYALVGTMCLSVIPVSIVQTVFSFRDKHCEAGEGKTKFVNIETCRTSIVHVFAAESSDTTQTTNERIFLVLGVAELALGLVLLGFDAVELSYTLSVEMVDKSWLAFGYGGIGIWGGLFVCASGVLCNFKPSSTVINANMAIGMLSATASFVIVVIYVVAAVTIDKRVSEFHAVWAALGFIAMIVCIAHSAFCCGVACWKQKADGRYALVTSRDTETVSFHV